MIANDEAKYFGAGMHSYYYHIIGLFEHEKAFSFVADFAQLCLQFTYTVTDDAVSGGGSF